MSRLSVIVPSDIPSLRTLLAAAMTPVHFVAGGTDVLIAGRVPTDAGLLVDVSHVADMSIITTEGGNSLQQPMRDDSGSSISCGTIGLMNCSIFAQLS